MLRTIISGVSWGVDDLPAKDGLEGGAQINLLDDQSGMMYHIPFTGNSLPDLMVKLAKSIRPEDRAIVINAFTGGIVVPENNEQLGLDLNK